jgi:hypothetical protein
VEPRKEEEEEEEESEVDPSFTYVTENIDVC